MLDGDTQTIPGWQNRAFANIVRPVIPHRLEVMLVQLAFSPLQIPSLRKLLRFDKKSKSEYAENTITGGSAGSSSSSDGGSSWLSFKPRYATQPPPRFLKLPEDEPPVVETHVIESNEDTPSSSPETDSDANAIESVMSENIKDGPKDTDGFNSAANTPKVNELTEDLGMIGEIEPSTSERLSDSSEIQHEEPSQREHEVYSPDKTALSEERNVDDKPDRAKVKSVNSGTSYSPSKTKGGSHSGDRSRANSTYKSEKISEEKTIKKVRTPEWFGYDDDDDDDAFSTTLGPITKTNQRRMMLPKQINSSRREPQIYNV